MVHARPCAPGHLRHLRWDGACFVTTCVFVSIVPLWLPGTFPLLRPYCLFVFCPASTMMNLSLSLFVLIFPRSPDTSSLCSPGGTSPANLLRPPIKCRYPDGQPIKTTGVCVQPNPLASRVHDSSPTLVV